MIGEKAALIVQAEEHVLQARRELYIAMNRLRSLENMVTPNVARMLETLRIGVQAKINDLEIEKFQTRLRVLCDAGP
ncbi:MAG: hypothetical protein WC315_00625 [Candidatus Omnitrophota bacterium]|jgi:hypothetical protein